MQCAMQGVVLAATFAVSHNVEEAKPLAAGSATTSSLQRPYAERDWGIQQVCIFPHVSLICAITPVSYLLLGYGTPSRYLAIGWKPCKIINTIISVTIICTVLSMPVEIPFLRLCM